MFIIRLMNIYNFEYIKKRYYILVFYKMNEFILYRLSWIDFKCLMLSIKEKGRIVYNE